MNKHTFETIRLAKGEMNVYDFGEIKLHAYKTHDFIDDEVFLVEKNRQAVLIESPCFFDNNKELEAYLSGNHYNPAGMLMYGKVSQENYVELTAASAIPNKEIKSPQILRY